MEFPIEFKQRISDSLGLENKEFFSSFSLKPPVSIRVNESKTDNKPGFDPVSWCESGYYLGERPAFTFDPLFHAGLYYVQEASSMLLEQAFKKAREGMEGPIRVLDLCAAPGGKSTLLSSLLREEDLLLANEVIKSRAPILEENLIKWGRGNALVSCNDPEDFKNLGGYFDIVVVDAPCSGEGLFRRDPGALDHWSEENVTLCSLRQRRILEAAWNVLKQGGQLIYSTCTYNRPENEDNISWMQQHLGAELVEIPVRAEWKMELNSELGRHCYPHRVRGEGFFISLLRKESPASFKWNKKWRNWPKPWVPAPQKHIALVQDWIKEGSELLEKDARLYALPCLRAKELLPLFSELYIRYAGVELGAVKGDKVNPAHGLAMYTGLKRGQFPEIELGQDQALAFLRKENPILPEAPIGWLLLCHRGHPLGWAKNLGNRMNNYYPKEWRIKSSRGEYSNILIKA